MLVLRKKKVNKTDYYSLWDQENNNSERLMNIGNLESLRVKLVKAEKFDELTKKYSETVTKLTEGETEQDD